MNLFCTTMSDSKKLDSITKYVSFIGIDRHLKWSYFQNGNSEFNFNENPYENLCCLLMGSQSGYCDECLVNKVFEGKSFKKIELWDNKSKCWMVSAYPALDTQGSFCGVILSGESVNGKKQSEVNYINDSLIESERRLSTLLSNLPGLVYRCKNDKQWTMEFVSQGCFELTGYMPEELRNNNKIAFNDLIAPDYQLEVWNNWQRAIQEKKSFTGEYQIITSDGSRKWVWEQGQAVFNDSGDVVALEGFIQDTTVRKNTEIALSRSEEKNRNLIESALVGIYTTRLNGEIIVANDALCRMLEFDSVDEILNVSNVRSVYVNPEDRDIMLQVIQKEGKVTDYELIWKTKKGRRIFVIISAILSGDLISGMVMDITERKFAEHEILEQKERAEQSDKLKAAFLANISHEIRTPLNGILGFTEILLEQEITPDEKGQYSKLIHDLSAQLLSIVNDILEISRIETHQIKIVNSQINLNQILYKLFNIFEKPSKEKKLILSLNSELKENQAIVYGDELRLVQVLTHLLNNALKFTSVGSINFGCRVFNNMLQFFVSDTGIGILPENRDIIFERFRQVEDALTRKYGGSGLGLSISKALVEMMGGEIYIDPYSEVGSTFYINIPYQVVPQYQKKQRNPLETKSCLRDCKILVCEDDDFGFLYLNRLLTQAGASTIRALSGNSAINVCQSEQELDLIIMDLRMPEMSGNDAAAYIKKIRPTIPIVICTASSRDEIEYLLRDNLFDDVVLKPIVSSNLMETICRLI